MDETDKILSERNTYLNLKSNVEYIIKNLTACIDNLEIPASEIKELYNVNSEGVDNSKLKIVREDLINRCNYLKRVVLYEIDLHLRELSKKIEGIG